MVVTITQQNIYIIIIHLMKLGYIKFEFMELQQYKGGKGGFICGKYYFEINETLYYGIVGREAGIKCGKAGTNGTNGAGRAYANCTNGFVIVAGEGGNSENDNKGGNVEENGYGVYGGGGATIINGGKVVKMLKMEKKIKEEKEDNPQLKIQNVVEVGEMDIMEEVVADPILIQQKLNMMEEEVGIKLLY